MKKAAAAFVILAASVGATACGSAQAKAPATRPALEVPPPPPRLIEPLPAEPVAAMEPVADLPPAAPTTSRPRSQPSRETTREAAAKPEAKPETPPAVEPPAAAPPAAASTPQIRAPGDNSETARQVRDTLDRTARTLNGIDYGPLSKQRKESYETAKRFIAMAEDALKTSNVEFAKYLAGKAEVFAKELQGR